MKICFVLEGNYPYVRGGVSTWVDGFIRSLPRHHFALWTITDLESNRGGFAYELPDNVIEVSENCLGTSFNLRIDKNPNLKFSAREREAIAKLIRCGDPDWDVLLNIFHLHSEKPVEFFLSEEFLSMLKELAREQFPFASFSDLFWTVRSMFLPLLFLMGQPMPEADLYHSPSTGYAGVLAALASKKYNKPFVLTEHGIYTREREEEILRSDWVIPHFKDYWISMFFMFARLAYQQANRVTSLYRRASLIQQELGCAPEKCDMVPNGLDVDAFSAIPDKPEDGWVDIAAIVRFAPIKDIKTMIYSFSRLKQEFEKARLHIVGGVDDEEYHQECLDLIKYLDIKDIVMPGNVNTRQYLEKIDFTILTSISEGQPFAVLESMAARRPVIATDVGCCRELIEGDEGDNFDHAGICVPPMHQTKLLQALMQLCENESLRKSMGLAGQERVQHFYRINNVMNDYQKVYEKAISIWQASVLN
ncbi:MAG TPA: GT4 family glycosyltransferase PelF [Anaerolineales bacterium]|nr:GT4 family glycosyltransferase PelF [Anaerolineales bacterium]